MRRTYVVSLVAALAWAGAAGAQPEETSVDALTGRARPLALGQALEVAVRQNPGLARATIDVSIAEAAILEAEGVDDWLATADLSVSRTETAPVEGSIFQITKRDRVGASAGLARNFAFGGSLGIQFDTSVTQTTSRIEVSDMGVTVVEESDSEDYFGGVSLEYAMPILRGFGEDIARAVRKRAQLQKSSAELRSEVLALDTVRDIIQAYWELAYLTEEIDIRRGSLELAQEQLRITRAGIEAGSVAPTEALAVEQAIAVREEAILLAEVALAEQSLALRRLVGLEVGPGEIELVASDQLGVPKTEFDLDATLARAFETSPQLALLEVEGESAALDVAIALDRLKPRLDLTASAGPTGNASSVGDAASELTSFDNFTVAANLSFEQAFGRRSAKGALESARHQQRRLKFDVEEVRRDLAASVVHAVNQVRAARKRIEVTQKSIELALQNLEAERARFEAGHATNFDVLQRQNELEQARLANTRAVADYLRSVAAVESLTGDLLPRYGIEVMEDDGGGAR